MKRPSAFHKATLGCGLLSIAAAIGLPATAQQSGDIQPLSFISSNRNAQAPTQADIFTPSYTSSPSGVWAVAAGGDYRSGAVSFTSSDGSSLPPGSFFIPASARPSWVTLNSQTGELTVAPPVGTELGYYPIGLQVFYPDQSSETITVNILISEKVTGSESQGYASHYTPVALTPDELAVPGTRSIVDFLFYNADFTNVLAGQDLMTDGIFASISLPENAKPWVTVEGGQVIFDLPADIPAGVIGIWQTVEVHYTDGTSEYVNVVLALDPGYQPAPTLAPSAPVETSPTPTLVPSQEATPAPSLVPSLLPSQAPTALPTQAPSAQPTPVPSVAPTAIPSPVPTLEPSQEPTLSPTVLPVPTVSAPAESNPSADPSPSATTPADDQPSVTPSTDASATAIPSVSVSPSALPSESVATQPTVPSASASPSQVPSLGPVLVSPSASAEPTASAVSPLPLETAEASVDVTPQAKPVLPESSASASASAAPATGSGSSGSTSSAPKTPGQLAYTGTPLVTTLWVVGMTLCVSGVILLARDRRRGH